MAIDVNAFNQLVPFNNCYAQCCIPAAAASCGALGATAGSASGSSLSFAANAGAKPCALAYLQVCCLWTSPWCCCTWSTIPTLGTVTGGTLVCDTTFGRCGASTTYTVPAGATYLRFQMWGAGAGSYNMCCCGGSPFGGQGAYGSVIIPAVPGCQYVLCSGCAACCNNTEGGIGSVDGYPSYVTGYGLTGVCADGGDSNNYNWLMRSARCASNLAGYCVMMGGYQEASTRITCNGAYGNCLCSGGGFCAGSYCWQTAIPFSTSCRTPHGYTTYASNNCHVVVGAPGVFAAAIQCYCSCYQIFSVAPPTVCWTSGCVCCIVYFSPGSTCGGLQGSCGGGVICCLFNMPGRGGFPTSASGGVGNCGGFMGAGGAVCVQYTTTT